MNNQHAFWWGLTTAYVAFTYATLGVMPVYWREIDGLLAGNGILFQYFLYSATGVAVFVFLYGKGFLHSQKNLLVTGMFIAIFALMFYFEKNPGEKIHMFQYGILGWLLYKALTQDFDSTSGMLYVAGGSISLVTGALDECIQAVLPNRYFTLHDVIINGLSGVMVQLYIYFYSLHRCEREASYV